MPLVITFLAAGLKFSSLLPNSCLKCFWSGLNISFWGVPPSLWSVYPLKDKSSLLTVFCRTAFHPVCCTVLMVMKALLHFSSALPSRRIQGSCKPAVLHLPLETERFCLLHLLFNIISFTLPSTLPPTFGSLQAKELLKDRFTL